jgi:hypothetical protein
VESSIFFPRVLAGYLMNIAGENFETAHERKRARKRKRRRLTGSLAW